MNGDQQQQSGPQALTAAQEEQLSTWRAMALQLMPYFAPILFEAHVVNVPGFPTFAVDRDWRMYIGFDEVAKKGDRWCAESLLHEAGHLWADHAGRSKDLGLCNPDGTVKSAHHGKISNYASDAEINDDLVDAGCQTLADDGILPSSIGCANYETFELYAKHLMQQSPPPPPPQPGPGQPGGQPQGAGGQQSSPGQGQPGAGGQRPGQGSGNGQPIQSGKGCGSGSGNAPLGCELPGHDSLGGAAKPATAADKERALGATAHAITEAQKSRGNVPGGLVEQATKYLTPPQVPWQKILAAGIRASARTRPGDINETYAKRNRRRHHAQLSPGRTIIYPGTDAPQPIIACVRDTSGSMSKKDLEAVTSEVVGISKSVGVKGDDLKVLDVDAAVHSVKKFTGAKMLNEVSGRGGTDMRVGVQAAAELKPRPHVCVILTDGWTPFPSAPVRGMKIIACIVGENTKNDARMVDSIPSWIKQVHIERSKK